MREIVAGNRTLLVNEPTYTKYGFDNNVAGAQRFFVENAPELVPAAGEFRVDLMAGSPDLRVTLNTGGAEQPRGVIVPWLSSLLVFNATQGTGSTLSVENVTLSHTAWELAANTSLQSLRGSGPLPVETAALQVVSADAVTVSNVTVTHMGANGMTVFLTPVGVQVRVAHSLFADVGATAVHLERPLHSLVWANTFRQVGLTWAQGCPLIASTATDLLVAYNDLREFASDGILLGSITAVTVHNNFFAGNSNLVAPGYEWTVGDLGAVHTAVANATQPSLTVRNNVICNMSGPV